MQPHRHPRVLVLNGRALQGALEPPDHGLGQEDPAGTAAGRARLGHGLHQRRAHQLPRHLDQAEVAHRERAGTGAIPGEVLPQLLEHLVTVRPRLHVNEIAYDDAADVAEPQLPRYFARRLDIGPQDRLLGILLARVPAGVDVNRDQRLRLLDDDVTTGRQVHAAIEEVPDLRFDFVLVEQRRVAAVQLHSLLEVRAHLVEVGQDLVMQLLGVHRQVVHLGAEQVADDAARQAGFALHHGRRAHEGGLLLDLLPQLEERIQLALEVILRQLFAHGPHDHAARVLGQDVGHHLAEPGTLVPRLDLAAHPDPTG